MTKNDIKEFNRYLKCRGIYSSFWREVYRQPERRDWIAPMKFMLENIPTDFQAEPLMRLVNWGYSALPIWHEEFNLASAFFSEYNYTNENKNELFNKIEKAYIKHC